MYNVHTVKIRIMIVQKGSLDFPHICNFYLSFSGKSKKVVEVQFCM